MLRRAIRLGCRAWHPCRTLVTRARIRRAHAAGLKVHVWTVNEPREAKRLARWGVDGVFTDDPGRMLEGLR
jgi:glycerophosphoryl diester phosphodiesterase